MSYEKSIINGNSNLDKAQQGINKGLADLKKNEYSSQNIINVEKYLMESASLIKNDKRKIAKNVRSAINDSIFELEKSKNSVEIDKQYLNRAITGLEKTSKRIDRQKEKLAAAESANLQLIQLLTEKIEKIISNDASASIKENIKNNQLNSKDTNIKNTDAYDISLGTNSTAGETIKKVLGNLQQRDEENYQKQNHIDETQINQKQIVGSSIKNAMLKPLIEGEETPLNLESSNATIKLYSLPENFEHVKSVLYFCGDNDRFHYSEQYKPSSGMVRDICEEQNIAFYGSLIDSKKETNRGTVNEVQKFINNKEDWNKLGDGISSWAKDQKNRDSNALTVAVFHSAAAEFPYLCFAGTKDEQEDKIKQWESVDGIISSNLLTMTFRSIINTVRK